MIQAPKLTPTTYIYGWQDLIVRVKHEANGIIVRKATLEVCAALNAFGRACTELSTDLGVSWIKVRGGFGSYV